MYKIHLIELIRVLPEMALYAIFSCVLSKTNINYKKILSISVIMFIVIYFIKLLPVEFGIHSLLLIVLLMFLNIKINKINNLKSIQVSILSFILMYVVEIITIILFQFVLKIDFAAYMLNPVHKALLGIPSLMLYGLIVFIINKIINRKK